MKALIVAAFLAGYLAGHVDAAPRSGLGSPFSAPSPASAGLSAESGTGSGFGVPAQTGVPPSVTGATMTPSDVPSPTASATPSHRPTPKVPSDGSGASVSGVASWYRWRPGQAAAGPALRRLLGAHWRGKLVTVCAKVCVRVRLTDWCACPQRVIDLDSRTFARLLPLSRGLVRVTVG